MKQLTHETDKHYQLFQQYLLAGASRSKSQVAIDNQLGKKQIIKIATKNHWEDRSQKSDQKQRQRLIHNFSKNYQSARNLRLENLSDLYTYIQENMNKFTSYLDIYAPLKDTQNPEHHIDRLDKALRMLQRYQNLSDKFEKALIEFGVKDIELPEQNNTTKNNIKTNSENKTAENTENTQNIHPYTPFSQPTTSEPTYSNDTDTEDIEEIDQLLEQMKEIKRSSELLLAETSFADTELAPPDLSNLSPNLQGDLARYFTE